MSDEQVQNKRGWYRNNIESFRSAAEGFRSTGKNKEARSQEKQVEKLKQESELFEKAVTYRGQGQVPPAPPPPTPAPPTPRPGGRTQTAQRTPSGRRQTSRKIPGGRRFTAKRRPGGRTSARASRARPGGRTPSGTGAAPLPANPTLDDYTRMDDQSFNQLYGQQMTDLNAALGTASPEKAKEIREKLTLLQKAKKARP